MGRLKNKGFSLIELMIVIAILGVVAALAIPAYDDYIIRAKVTNMLTAADTVQEAVAESRQVNGNFNAIVPGDPATTFTNLGISDPTTITPALSAVLFVTQDLDHVAIVLCGATAGQGSPDDADTVDLYLAGTYYTSGMKWTCEYAGNSNYVPISCRTLYQNSLYGTLAGACPRIAPTPVYQ